MGDATIGGLRAACRIPTRRAWAEAALLFAIFTALTALIGLGGGLFEYSPHVDRALLITAVVAVFVPALGEELVFRVLLQPRPPTYPSSSGLTGGTRDRPIKSDEDAGRDGKRWPFTLPSIALFVLWHPVQVWLGLPMAQPVFLDLRFVIIAALLGIACTISWQRSGSIWPAVAIHWAAVIGWKGLLA